MKVSVLIPIYNAEKYLEEAINSILNQTFKDLEVLLLDDGSTDESKKIEQRLADLDPRVRYLPNEQNMRIVRTLNRGISLAQGEYLVRMDADDISHPDRIEKQVKFMDENPSVGISGTWFKLSTTGEEIKHPLDNKSLRIKLISDTCFAHPTVIMRASVLKEFNLQYDINTKQGEDYEMWIRCMQFTELANLPEVLLTYRVHESQLTQKFVEELREYTNSHRLKVLKILDLETSDYEKKIHLTLVTKIPAGIRIADYNKWINRFLEANNTKHFFDETLLKAYLSEKWIYVIENTSIFTISNIYPFLFSKVKNDYYKLSFKAKAKFLLKSLLIWSKLKKYR